ncbi:MAG: AMP-binding protein [Betaproteobacteria bacterium]
MTTRPLLVGFEPADILAWRESGGLTACRAFAAAASLAASLPRARHAINLCETLDRFLVAALATWISGGTLVLPPTRLQRTLDDMRERYPDSVCLTDSTVDAATAIFAVDPWLDVASEDADPRVAAWPEVADDHVAAILFTSGSTGAPQPHAKTWGELADGARAFMHSIGFPPAGVAIVGTVPPQHMFGFEATVLLPLQSGTPVLTSRPAFAADLADTLDCARKVAPAGVWLMTTPLQLRAFHRQGTAEAGIARVVASTMPLDPEVACAVERDWGAPVHEIYGCTEGGILAVRRASLATTWTPAAGVAFAIDADGHASASGGHLRGTIELADRLRAASAPGAFELVGRDADLVKIAGKRASLAGLTRELLALPGVDDGVVFLPSEDARRVAAVVVAPGRAPDLLSRELALRVDPAFLPRPLLCVDALPRHGAGKLPLEALRALVARTGAGTDGASPRELAAQLTFAAGHPALPGHFPGHPIVPGVLLLAKVEEMLRGAGLRVVECVQAKFLAPVLPEETVTLRIAVDAGMAARFDIAAGGRSVAAGSLRCVRTDDAP